MCTERDRARARVGASGLAYELEKQTSRSTDHPPYLDYISKAPRANSRDHRGHVCSVTPHPMPCWGTSTYLVVKLSV